MSFAIEKVLHVVVRLGLDALERAYDDLPAAQRAKPCVRQAMNALHKMHIANGFCAGRKPLEEPLSELAAAWWIASKDLGPDDVIDRWLWRHVHRPRIALAEKKQRHVQR